MNKLQKLRAQLAEAAAKMLALDALATRENRDLTADETTTFNAHEAECTSLKAQIARQEALVEAERHAASVPAITPGASVGHNHAEDKPWANVTEQLSAIRAASMRPASTDVRLLAAQGGSEYVESDGGFLVAPEFSSEIVRRTFADGQVASRCSVTPMASNRLVMNGVNDASRVDGSRNGGITSFWTYEAAQYTKSKPTFRQIALQTDKLTVFTYGTDELLGDTGAWEAYVNEVVPDEFAFKVDDAIFNGPGTGGGPLGINNTAAIITVAKDSGQTAGTISNTNVFGMYKRMPGYLRKDACWYVNQDIEDQLWNLTRGSGTAVELLYSPPGQRGNNSDYGVLLGKPVIPIEQAQTVGTQGDITFAAFSQYKLGRRGGIKADTSIHVAFLTGEQAFRWQMRIAGESLWDKPVTPKNGSNTQSPFIQVATRS